MWILPLDKKEVIFLMAAIIGFSLIATTIMELIPAGVIVVVVSFFLYSYLRHKKAKAKKSPIP